MNVEFLFWVLVLFINGILNSFLTIKLYRWHTKRNEMKFVRSVAIKNPHSKVSFVAIESSDRDALNKLKEQLNEFHN